MDFYPTMGSARPIEFKVNDHEVGQRLELFLREHVPGLSRGSIRRLLERGQVLVNGRKQKKGYRLEIEQQVLVASAVSSEQPIPQRTKKLDIIAVRPTFVVINKAAGEHCHPLVPGEMDTLANALVARFPECINASPNAREGGLVNRLDWCTSGLVIAARTREAYGYLRGLFSESNVKKHYLALVDGHVKENGIVDVPVQTVPGDSSQMRAVSYSKVDERGRPAQTKYWPVEILGRFTLVDILCCTGVRHQVRVHMAHVGHPLVGDIMYGGPMWPGVEGAFLHASSLEISSDLFISRIPPKRRKVLKKLGWMETF